MATLRREAREWALQMLFRLEMNPAANDRLFEEFWAEITPEKRARRFTEGLFAGVRDHRDAIDVVIEKYAKNWSLARMSVIDRNVLRLAIYEMMYRDDIPAVVSINEAVDIAKYFNTRESGRFVNGILDRVRKEGLSGAAPAPASESE